MDLLRIYARALTLLGPEARLGWLLGLGNLALAGSQFAEPVLFGRIIDALAGTGRSVGPATFSTLAGLIAAWIGFGLFAICGGVAVSVDPRCSRLPARASDTLGNIALVQGYARVEAEVSGLRNVVDRLLAAQIPVLSWWALAAVITRASTTLTLVAIFITGIWLHFQG